MTPNHPPTPHPHRNLAPLFGLLATALLVGASTPAGATHPQSTTSGGLTFGMQFDHDGDNEWWVEVQARGLDGDFAAVLDAIVEGGSEESGGYVWPEGTPTEGCPSRSG